ncbi:MAG: IS66 family transposase [Planctomycetota bacterium]|nr:IS66 family transposase [Planctomycetota bacterium]
MAITDSNGVTTTRDIAEENVQLVGQVDALTKELKILRDELALLKRGLYGRRSERFEPGQLGIFDELVQSEQAEVPEPAPEPHPKKKRGHGRAPFAAHLPREVIELDLAKDERECKCCGKPMKRIGEEITERGHCIPSRVIVKRYVRIKYACPDGHSMATADLPDSVIDGGKYEASVYAHVITSKYADHLPLHRMEGIFKRRGVRLSKQSMWDMVKRADELLVQPVLKQMRDELLEEPVLHADETPVTMRLEDGKGTKQGFAWGWRNLLTPDRPSKVLIDSLPSRGRDGPTNFLGDWSGTLIADGYAGYDQVVNVNGIRRAGCWAHARRKLKEALDTGSKCAAPLLALVQRLFEVERPINEQVQAGEIDRGQQLELRRVARADHSSVTIAAITAEVDRLLPLRSTLPKSKLGKALGYLHSQRAPLSAFLEDPRIPIHNNDSERDLRHLAIGRNNWLVFGSQLGGEVACRMYSLMLSCKQGGVDPEAYIADGLDKISLVPASQIASLTPWAWQASRRDV